MASKRWFALTLLMAGLFVLAPAVLGISNLLAQEGAEKAFLEAVDLYQRGRDAEALAKLQEVLAMDPSQEEAYRMRESVEYTFWLDLMVKGGDHDLIARRILDLARLEDRAKADDGDAIRGYIADLASEDFPTRTRARLRLSADHGAYAVPYLLTALKETTEREVRIQLLYTLTEMGDQVTWPLVEVLRGSDADLRRSAIIVLGNVHDRRAAPSLLWHLETGTLDAGEGELIEEALMKMGSGAGASARDELLALAVALAHKDPNAIRDLTVHRPLWQWTDAGLVHIDVPPYLHPLLLAESRCYDALDVAPGDTEVLAVLANILFMERNAAETAAAAADESEEELDPRIVRIVNLAHATGGLVLDEALRIALAHDHGEVAVSCIDALAAVDPAGVTGGEDALLEALDSADKRVQYAAATAMASRVPQSGMIDMDAVIHTLIRAVGEESVRVVLVIDNDADTRNTLLALAREHGMAPLGADSGATGLARAKALPGADLFVVRAGLPDATVDRMLAELSADFRTKDVPVVLLATGERKTEVENLYGSRVAAVIETPVQPGAADALVAAFGEDRNLNRLKAVEVASRAATALFLLAHSGQDYPLAQAVPALVDTLDRPDVVRLPAIKALGFIGDSSATAPLVDVFTNTGNAAEVRAAAAVAVGQISGLSGQMPPEAFDALVEGIADDESSVAAAAAKALGMASVAPEQRTEALKKMRPPAGTGEASPSE